MVARRLYVPEAQPSRDHNGRALPARLAFFEPSGTYDQPKTVYADASLTTPLVNPVQSNSAGQFPAIWADSAQTFDVVWSDLALDRLLGSWTNVSPLTDVAAASVTLADAAKAGAEAAKAGAEAARDLAGDAQAAAEEARDQAQAVAAQVGNLGDAVAAAQAWAEAAEASAEAAAQFDPTHYVTSIAGYGGSVTAAQLKTALGLDKLKRRRLLLNLDFG